MGLIFRKRRRLGPNSWLNLSKSGVSGSTRIGRLTLNSRGGGSVRLGKGLSLNPCIGLLIARCGNRESAFWTGRIWSVEFLICPVRESTFSETIPHLVPCHAAV
jgi:hypothetical protein